MRWEGAANDISGVREALGHELVHVVVVSVVQAVDVVKPSVPARPLPITYPPLGEGRHPNTIGLRTVAGYRP